MWARGGSLSPVARHSMKFLALCPETEIQPSWQSKFSLSYISPTRNFSISTVCSKGHNKWSNIKHIKGARDAEIAKKNQLFRNRIVIAVKSNGNSTNPDSNIALRRVLEEAKSQMVSFFWKLLVKLIQLILPGAKDVH